MTTKAISWWDLFFSGSVRVPGTARIFILLVISASAPILASSVYSSVVEFNYPLLYLIALAAVVSSFPVKIPLVKATTQSLSITMADIVVFFAIFLIGPEGAVMVAAVEAVTISVHGDVRELYKKLFNVAQLATVAFVVARVFYFLNETPPPLEPTLALDRSMLFIEAGFCGLLYFALNSGLLATAIALTTSRPILKVWQQNLLWPSITHFAGACLSALVFLNFRQLQLYFVGVAIPIMVLIYYAYKTNLERILEAQRHVEEVNKLLAREIEAEQKLQVVNEQLEIRVHERTSELAAEKERLSVTLYSIEDGVITTDAEGRIMLLNKKAGEIIKVAQSQAVGKRVAEIFDRPNANIAQSFSGTIDKVLSEGKSVVVEVQDVMQTPAGVERIIAHHASPISSDGNRVAGVVLVFHDTTQQRRMEEELLKTQKLESLGLLAGGIAHDFNNTLAGVLLKAQLAKRACKKGGDPTEFLTSIEEASRLATGLTKQLLTFAKGGEPIKETVWLRWLIEESSTFALRGSKVRCELQIARDLWPAKVDRGQIVQVIHNLVLNAAQAMPEGGTIRVSAVNFDVTPDLPYLDLAPGPYIRICVEDEGVGIPPDTLRHIFDPYFTTKPGGHGLGLPTSRSIVKRHGGVITAESTPGRGSSFTFCLPASSEPVKTLPREDVQPVRRAGRVLVMDDEAVIREAIQALLQEVGYQVDFTGDGVEAIAAYKEKLAASTPYDTVIMDLTIPGGMGGKEAVGELLAVDPQAAVVVSSGYSEDPVLADYRRYGFSAILIKPFTFEQLAGVLEQVRRGMPRQESSA